MKLLGLEITKAIPTGLQTVHARTSWNGIWGVIRESFSGAWQHNVELASTPNMLAFGAVYACVRLIAFDISKLRIKLVREVNGVWQEQTQPSPFLPVLRKPNHYQNRIQFLKHWVISKLLHGNTYILKVRDDRGLVTGMYVLDPSLVVPMVTPDGDVYYEIRRDNISRVESERLILPASEIIHDRMLTLFHPLVGVSPIYASGAAATQGIQIQNNSAMFFKNMSQPSGILSAPGAISHDTAMRLKQMAESGFSGPNLGRMMVVSDGMKYQAMTIPAVDAQLIEQLKWTGEEVARAFGVPPHKIGLGAPPTFNNIGSLNQDYYSQTLQHLIESIELLLDEGLGLLGAGYGAELDLDGLLRLDPLGRAELATKRIGAGYVSPNEERLAENLPPVEGGNSPMMQQQNWNLASLAKRQPPEDKPTVAAPPEKPDEERIAEGLIMKFLEAA